MSGRIERVGCEGGKKGCDKRMLREGGKRGFVEWVF